MKVKQEVLHWNLISIATYEDIIPAKISLSRPTLHALYTNSRLFSFEPPRLWNYSLSNHLEKFGAESFWEKISPVSLSLHLMVATVNYHMSDQVFRQKWKSIGQPENGLAYPVWMKICYFFLLQPFPEKRFEGSSVSDGVFHNEDFDHQIWHLPQHHLQGVHLKAAEWEGEKIDHLKGKEKHQGNLPGLWESGPCEGGVLAVGHGGQGGKGAAVGGSHQPDLIFVFFQAKLFLQFTPCWMNNFSPKWPNYI